MIYLVYFAVSIYIICILFICSAFCPVHCGPDDLHCPGPWDHATGKQSSPDFCMPMKDPATGCHNMCPVQCAEHDQVCPGTTDVDGCYTGDICHSKDGKIIVQHFKYFLKLKEM